MDQLIDWYIIALTTVQKEYAWTNRKEQTIIKFNKFCLSR